MSNEIKEAYVHSSAGELTINADTGEVTNVDVYPGEQDTDYLTSIKRFDLKERRKTYPDWADDDHFDILDLGYWSKQGHYAKPEHNWRLERDTMAAGGEL